MSVSALRDEERIALFTHSVSASVFACGCLKKSSICLLKDLGVFYKEPLSIYKVPLSWCFQEALWGWAIWHFFHLHFFFIIQWHILKFDRSHIIP